MRLKVKDIIFDTDEIIAYGKLEVSITSPGVEGVAGPMVISNPAIIIYLKGGGQLAIRFNSPKERDEFFNRLEKILPPHEEFILNKH